MYVFIIGMHYDISYCGIRDGDENIVILNSLNDRYPFLKMHAHI